MKSAHFSKPWFLSLPFLRIKPETCITLEAEILQGANAMSQGNAQHIQYKTTNFVTVVGFTSPYLQAEEVIEKVGIELFDLVETKGLTKIILSFNGVRFVSSSMLAQVVKLHKRLAKAKGRLRICCLAPELSEVLRVSQLDKLLEIFPDEALALAKF